MKLGLGEILECLIFVAGDWLIRVILQDLYLQHGFAHLFDCAYFLLVFVFGLWVDNSVDSSIVDHR